MAHLEPRVSAAAIRPLLSAFRALGHDPVPLLAAIGLDEATLADPDARVPMGTAVAFLTRGAEQTRDSNLGLHLAEHAELSAFDVHFYAMASSATLGHAFALLGRYQRLIHDTSRVDLVREGDRAAVLRHTLPGGRAVPRQAAEFVVAAWLRVGRAITGSDWAPLEVRFAHPAPPDTSDHIRFFAADVRFSTGENALVLPVELLETPCTRADPTLAAVLDRYAVVRLDQAPRTDSIADRVRHALAEDLRGGEPAAARTAARLKMSIRSLNRLLAAEGTSYRALLDALRRDLATRHLSADRRSAADVAFALGFSDLSAFHRAFKRWTGLTPGQYVAQRRSTR